MLLLEVMGKLPVFYDDVGPVYYIILMATAFVLIVSGWRKKLPSVSLNFSRNSVQSLFFNFCVCC